MEKLTEKQVESFRAALTTVKVLQRRIDGEPAIPLMQLYQEVAEDAGISPNTLRIRFRAWKAKGDKALIPSLRGRKIGEGKFLTDEDEAELKKLIVDRTPDQLKMPFALWTRKAVQELIYSKYGVELAITAVGNYLRKWGFTVQKPIVKKAGQRPAAVEAWLKDAYPAIQAQAKQEDAEIWWRDETAVQNEPHQLKGYAPRGQTPTLVGPRKRIHLTMVSAVSNWGAVRFKVYSEAINVERFKDFLNKMIKDANGRKIILIVDNLKVHHAKDLQPWLAENIHLIELKFLPSYSPELNPDEYLNRDMKSRLAILPTTSSKTTLEDRVVDYMIMLEGEKALVSSFFSYPQVRYAA